MSKPRKIRRYAMVVQSPYRAAIESLGFRVVHACIVNTHGQSYLQCRFNCRCGRTEILTVQIDEHSIAGRAGHDGSRWLVDPFRRLFLSGAVSPQHLRADGFDEEFVDALLPAYNRAVGVLPLKYAESALIADS